jgi:hypothetical protein
MGEMSNAYKVLDGKFEWERPPGRRRRRWEYNIKMGLKVMDGEVINCTHVDQYRDH